MITSEAAARDYVASRCDPAAMDRLDKLHSLLLVENERQNLISAGSVPMIWNRHIADSAQLLDWASGVTPHPWLDLGTGAGFPGLVIAAMRPEMKVVLVESRIRRAEWLEKCRTALSLASCNVIHARLETIGGFRSSVISARAFAPLPKLIALARRFSTSDTRWLLPKGRSATQELAALPVSTRKLFHVEQSISDPDAGILIGSGLESAS